MKSLIATAVLFSILGCASSAYCQQEAMLSRAYTFVPKSGQGKSFEDALKNHLKWAKENGEPWNWMTYQIVMGEGLGRYVCISPGHTVNDFDEASEHRRKAAVHFRETVSPFLESVNGGLYWLHNELSSFQGLSQNSPYVSVTIFKPKPFATRDFLKHFAKLHEAKMTQDAPPATLTYSLISGGSARVLSVTPFENWAAAAGNYRKSRAAMKELGVEQMTEIRTALQATTVETAREIYALRPELSFDASPPEKDVASK